MARYTEKYTHLYEAWEGETRETQSTVETHLRTIADHYHTPCCQTPYFYDACSAVRCARCALSFCAVCHKMYLSDSECHGHVWLCIRSHADTHNTVPRPIDVFVSEATRDKYFVATRVRMIRHYACTPDRSILGVGGIVRWNNLVQSVLRAMLCSGNPNQRLVDALGIADTMLSPFCARPDLAFYVVFLCAWRIYIPRVMATRRASRRFLSFTRNLRLGCIQQFVLYVGGKVRWLVVIHLTILVDCSVSCRFIHAACRCLLSVPTGMILSWGTEAGLCLTNDISIMWGGPQTREGACSIIWCLKLRWVGSQRRDPAGVHLAYTETVAEF